MKNCIVLFVGEQSLIRDHLGTQIMGREFEAFSEITPALQLFSLPLPSDVHQTKKKVRQHFCDASSSLGCICNEMVEIGNLLKLVIFHLPL